MIRIFTTHNILKVLLVFSCIIYLIPKNRSSKALLKIGLKWQFLFFKPILGVIFVTMATVKLIKCRLLHLGFSSKQPIKEIGEMQLSVFGSRGGKLAP